MKRIAIIGAGAAGCYCAAQLCQMKADAAITVFEAGSKPLAKVAITGGGRCNLTNDFEGIRSLADAYPRGERLMKRALKAFSNDDTIRWFTAQGVPCVLQADHCWFPQSQDAMDVVRALLRAMKGVDLRLNTKVVSISCHSEPSSCHSEHSSCHSEHSSCHSERSEESLNPAGPSAEGIYFSQSFAKNQIPSAIATPTHNTDYSDGPVRTSHSEPSSCHSEPSSCHSERSEESMGYLVNGEPFDAVVVTTGGAQRFPFLEGLGLEIVPPVPSLFTFNVPDAELRALMGLVVEAQVGLQGTPFKAEGPLLITDWGLSGPAVLKLSSYAARHLADAGYKGTVGVNWLNASEAEVRERLREASAQNPQKQVSNTPLLQQRLWGHLIRRAGLREDVRWAEVGSKGLNRLVAVLTNDTYAVSGKSKFREEFVTAGGVALSQLDLSTLECKQHPGLYFAGEVLDVDAITGGFNLQAAWSTAFICAKALAK